LLLGEFVLILGSILLGRVVLLHHLLKILRGIIAFDQIDILIHTILKHFNFLGGYLDALLLLVHDVLENIGNIVRL